MIDATDRTPCLSGYTMQRGTEVIHVWPYSPVANKGLVVVEEHGVPVSIAETAAAIVPLTERNIGFLDEMWTVLLRAWRAK